MKKITNMAEFEELLKEERTMLFFMGFFDGTSKMQQGFILEEYYYSILLYHLHQKKVDFALGIVDLHGEEVPLELCESYSIKYVPQAIYFKNGIQINREIALIKGHTDFFQSALKENADDKEKG
ncbi:MAG: hypothetical protein FJZ75_10030 [Bacteroidetes bacterium]|nr:hypothetical protein [Bacteroidota bacterium]